MASFELLKETKKRKSIEKEKLSKLLQPENSFEILTTSDASKKKKKEKRDKKKAKQESAGPAPDSAPPTAYPADPFSFGMNTDGFSGLDAGYIQNDGTGGDIPMLTSKFTKVNFDEHMKSTQVKYDPKCFGCVYKFGKPANAEDPRGGAQMAKVYGAFVDTYGRISDEECFKLIAATQYANFVKPYEQISDKSMIPPIWTVDQVREHIEDHCVLMEFELQNQYRVLRHIEKSIRNHIFERDEATNEEKVNMEVLVAQFKAIEKVQNTWKLIQGTKHALD